MAKETNIRLKLPADFNYKLDVLIAKLRRDGLIKKDKTKAQILIECAKTGLLQKSKDLK